MCSSSHKADWLGIWPLPVKNAKKSTSCNFHLSQIAQKFCFVHNSKNLKQFCNLTYLMWKSNVLYLRNGMAFRLVSIGILVHASRDFVTML